MRDIKSRQPCEDDVKFGGDVEIYSGLVFGLVAVRWLASVVGGRLPSL